MKRSTQQFILFLSLLIILFTYAYKDILSSGMFAFSDIAPLPQNATQKYFHTFISAWNPQGFGSEFRASSIFLFTAFFFSIFGENLVLAQHTFIFSLIPLAGASMYIFLNRFIDSQPAKSLASFVYGVNPFTLGQFTYGGSPWIMTVYAVFPLLCISLFNILEKEEERIRNILLFTFFFTIAASHYPIVPIPIVAILVFVYVLFRRNLKYCVILTVSLMSSFVFFVLLEFPSLLFWFSQLISHPMDYVATLAAHKSVESLVATVRGTYSQAIPINLLRILNDTPWYGGSAIWNLSGLILPVLAFSSIFFISSINRRKQIYIVTFSILGLFIILFCWFTSLSLTLGLFTEFPILFVYRNPTRMMMILPLAYSPLIALTIEEMQKRLAGWNQQIPATVVTGRRKYRTMAFFVVLLLSAGSIGIYNWPLFTGDMGLSRCQGNKHIVPPVYFSIAQWRDRYGENESPYRVVILPFDSNTKLYSGVVDAVIDPPQPIIEALLEGRTDRAGVLLAPYNVRYIIVNLASPPSDPKDFIKVLNQQRDLKLIHNGGDFLVYENQEFVPIVSVYGKVALVLSPANDKTLSSAIIGLSDMPGFDITGQLMVFGKQLSHDQLKWFLNNSDVIVFLGDSSPLNVSPTQKLAFVYEAESSFIPESGYWREVKDISASNGYALEYNGIGKLVKEFYIPRDGYHRFALRAAPKDGIALHVDSRPLSTVQIEKNGEFIWYESTPLFLVKGKHNISASSDNSMKLDKMIIFSSYNDGIEGILGMYLKRINFTTNRSGWTQYKVETEAENSAFIVLGQTYHPSWTAYVDGERLQHFPAFYYANGFYLNRTGENRIKISFNGQKNSTIIIWVLSWISLVASLVYTSKKDIRRASQRLIELLTNTLKRDAD